MLKIIGAVLATALSFTSIARAEPISTRVRTELAPSGTLRIGINIGNQLLTGKDPVSGRYGGIAFDLAAELGRRSGIPTTIVTFDSAGKLAAGAKANAWDVAFLGIEPERAEHIVFTPAYAEIESTYLVPKDSPLRTITDVDRDGVRIAISEKSAYDLFLSRNLQHATLVRAPGVDGVPGIEAAYQVFVDKKLDAVAGLKPVLLDYADKLPGSKILDGHISIVRQAIGTLPGREAGAEYLRDFIADLKADGTIAQVIARNHARGINIPDLPQSAKLTHALTQTLEWPAELPTPADPEAHLFVTPKSNYLLDFHGSIQNPDLVIFLAGNQYRAFPELTVAFRQWAAQQPKYRTLPLANIFYATLPPAHLIDAMDKGKLQVGNFWFDVRPDALWPDVFMTNTAQHARLRNSGYTEKYSPYVHNRGVVLLIKAGNPKNIRGLADLARDDVKVAISAPGEPPQANSYITTLKAQAGEEFAATVLAKPTTVLSRVVHHRENPQFIADGLADVAPMYFHFGDYLKKTYPQQFDYIALPREGNAIEELSIAKIRTAPRPQAADAWIEFIRSDIAADIFTRNGFDYLPAAERNKELIPK